MKTYHNRTRIVTTLGPASSSEGQIQRLLLAGANVFRINFSHGTMQEHCDTVGRIRAVSKKVGIHCAILADLQGPKIRTGNTAGNKPIALRKGRRVTLTTKPGLCDDSVITVDYAHLPDEIRSGHRVLINDGAISLQVLDVDTVARTIECRVEYGGSYASHKGVNFPGVPLSQPSLTARDFRDIKTIVKSDFDYVALSFVRTAADILPLVRAIKRAGRRMRIIAKIEKPEATDNIDDICSVCDGIMVARGDLGVETSSEQIPVLQKHLIARANALGKQVIVATQMLESMIHNPMPTRAESTDVANAILDGADAVMLSGETAVGQYPVIAVETMVRIARTVEQSRWYSNTYVNLDIGGRKAVHAVCEAAATASADLGGTPVVVFTLSGDTALYLSKIRCQAPIFAFSPDPSVVSQLCLAWNCIPLLLPFDPRLENLLGQAEKVLLNNRLVRKGEQITVVGGTTSVHGATNFMRVKRVGG